MADNTLSILKPSVNNLSVRIFVRAAGLDFEEVDVWGQQGTDDFYAKDPSRLTPLLECDGLPRGALWESCAIMQYLCNKHGLERFYPTEPESGRWSTAPWRYHLATLYPLVARATYPTLGFGQYAGRGRNRSGCDRRDEGAGGEGRRGRARRPARRLPRLLPRRQRRSSAAAPRRSPTSASRRRWSS